MANNHTSDQLQVQWRECLARLFKQEERAVLREEGNDDESPAILSKMLETLEELASAEHINFLNAEPECATGAMNVVLAFLTAQTMVQRNQLHATKCLKMILLHAPVWREHFDRLNLNSVIPEDSLHELAAGVENLQEQKSHQSIFDRDHQETAASNLRYQLHEANQRLADHGARIVVLGDRGSGKSSLINAAFGRQLAKTGVGRAVTKEIKLYAASESCPVHIYDTIGFETGGAEAQDQLQKLIQERKEAAAKHSLDDPEHCQENLHMVWWVIDVIAGGRFNPEHIQQVSKLFRDSDIPIIMVLNKCDTLKDNVEEVEKEVCSTCPWAEHIVQVVTDPRQGPAKLSCECGSTNIFTSASTRSYFCSVCKQTAAFKKHYGVSELIQETVKCLPDAVAKSFLRAQDAWIEGLDTEVKKTILGCTVLAAAVAAVPIPFSRAVCVIPVQTFMILCIAKIYKVVLSKKAALHMASIVMTGGTSSLAFCASEAVKVIFPAAGVLVDAGMSCTSTFALAVVSYYLLRQVRSRAILGEEVSVDRLNEIMSDEELRKMYQQVLDRVKSGSKPEEQLSVEMKRLEELSG